MQSMDATNVNFLAIERKLNEGYGAKTAHKMDNIRRKPSSFAEPKSSFLCNSP